MADNAYVKYTIGDILESFKQPIPFEQPLIETIANSLEAEATEIELELFVDNSQQQVEDENIKTIRRINGFKITDNGKGFTPENIDSFTKFKSHLKRKLGCKGVGRFTWLKVYEDIFIESQTEETFVSFSFNKNFSVDDIKPIEKSSVIKQTSITFSNVTSQYKRFAKPENKREKDVDERTIADLKYIKELIATHFLVKFFLLHEEEKRNFKITLKLGQEKEVISNKNITKLNKKEFDILDTLDVSLNPKYYHFVLFYNYFESNNKPAIQSYCAAGRLVAPFTDTVKIISLPTSNLNLNMLLTSEYFDERTTEERNDFSFSKNEVNRTTVNPIPLNEINDKLKQVIDEILLEKFPNLSQNNDKVIEECIEERPYLGKYIRLDNTKIKTKSKVLNDAEKAYRKEKIEIRENFAKMLESKKYTDKTLFMENISKVNDISARELAEYFLYREQIILGLNKLIEDNSSIENDLHELFMPKNTISDYESTELSKYDSNIWLLDDKFMPYLKAYSDIEIGKIKEQIAQNMQKVTGELKKPDMTIFYNNVDSIHKDIVMVEFKALNVSADRKIAAYSEINRNLQFILKGIDNIRTMHGYIITDLDDEFCEYLEAQPGVEALFTTGNTPMYYYFNGNLKDSNNNKKSCHVYILSTNSICKDAQSRNKIFLDIIKNK